MSDEQYKVLRITRDDLLDWIDRPPSNADIELADYLVNALDNQRKYYEENTQLKSVLKEIREFCDYLLNNDKVSINGKVYYKTFDDDIVTKKLLEIINKGIGEDK